MQDADRGYPIRVKGKLIASVFFRDGAFKKIKTNTSLEDRCLLMMNVFQKLPRILHSEKKFTLQTDDDFNVFYAHIFPPPSKKIDKRYIPAKFNRDEILAITKKIIGQADALNDRPIKRTIVFIPAFLSHLKLLGSYYLYDGVVFHFFNPTAPWRRYIAYSLAHEYFHGMFFGRNKSTKKDNTILFRIITEGSAEHFSCTVNKIPPRYRYSLSVEEAKKLLIKIKPELKLNKILTYSESYLKNRKLWPTLATPHALGLHLMEAYCKKYPHVSWVEIASMRPRALFLKAWEAFFEKSF
jgi:hypothetical protein